MSKIVLDSSAILAILNRETGWEKLTLELLSEAISSTVNLAEVQAKLVVKGLSSDDAWEAAISPIRDTATFTGEHAKLAGSLIVHTRALGLSLGDRACLALGIILKAPVYTADKSWKNLKLGIRIQSIR